MNILWRFDDWLIEQTEKFCHWFQKWTGRTNYFLARISTFLIVGLITLVYFRLDRSLDVTMLVAVVALVLSVLLAFLTASPSHEEKAIKRLADGIANPYKVSIRFSRFYAIIISVLFLSTHVIRNEFSLKSICWIMLFSAITAFFYLISCDPLPPRAQENCGERPERSLENP